MLPNKYRASTHNATSHNPGTFSFLSLGNRMVDATKTNYWSAPMARRGRNEDSAVPRPYWHSSRRKKYWENRSYPSSTGRTEPYALPRYHRWWKRSNAAFPTTRQYNDAKNGVQCVHASSYTSASAKESGSSYASLYRCVRYNTWNSDVRLSYVPGPSWNRLHHYPQSSSNDPSSAPARKEASPSPSPTHPPPERSDHTRYRAKAPCDTPSHADGR